MSATLDDAAPVGADDAAQAGADESARLALIAGLNRHRHRVLGLMAGGFAFAGLAALAVEILMPAHGGVITILGPLVFAIIAAGLLRFLDLKEARILFWLFGAVIGLAFSTIFQLLADAPVAPVFLSAAVALGVVWLFGARDRSSDIGTWVNYLLVWGLGLGLVMGWFALQETALFWFYLVFYLVTGLVVMTTGLGAFRRLDYWYIGHATPDLARTRALAAALRLWVEMVVAFYICAFAMTRPSRLMTDGVMNAHRLRTMR
ncbi:MAG: hypothetical protein RIE31_00680 [Alphaproteobacteria bacterium]